MFIKNSRYYGLPTVIATDADGREVQAVKLRRLPLTAGKSQIVKGGDQLDVMAQTRYQDATRYWHVADANSELEAEALVRHDGRVIQVPEN